MDFWESRHLPVFQKSIRWTSARRALCPTAGRLYGARKSSFFRRRIWMKFYGSGEKLTNELWRAPGIVVKRISRIKKKKEKKKNAPRSSRGRAIAAYSLRIVNLTTLPPLDVSLVNFTADTCGCNNFEKKRALNGLWMCTLAHQRQETIWI